MSPEDYAEMTTDRLLPLFAGYAKRLGLGRILGGISAGSSPDLSLLAMDKEQRQRLGEELVAIVAALLTRPAGPDALSLFDDPDPDVRRRRRSSPATSTPIWLKRPGRGSRPAVRRRSDRGAPTRPPEPPAQPTLQAMSDEALLARFQDAGERVTACRVHRLGSRPTGHGYAQRASLAS